MLTPQGQVSQPPTQPPPAPTQPPRTQTPDQPTRKKQPNAPNGKGKKYTKKNGGKKQKIFYTKKRGSGIEEEKKYKDIDKHVSKIRVAVRDAQVSVEEKHNIMTAVQELVTDVYDPEEKEPKKSEDQRVKEIEIDSQIFEELAKLEKSKNITNI